MTGYSFSGLPSNTGYDFVTIAYSTAGVPLWTNRYLGPLNGPDQATAVTVDNAGNAFVAGYSSNGNDYDFMTIKYSSGVQPLLNFQRLSSQLVLSWTNAAFSLQSALATTETFTNIPGATSPYTNPIASGQQFFRLISN